MAIKLIAVDLDDTFLRPDKTYDVSKMKKVLNKLTSKDLKFVIATGNYIPTIYKYFDPEILEDIYLATDNGNILLKNHQIIRKVAVDRELAKEVYSHIINRPGYYPFFSTGEMAYVQTPVSEWAENRISFYFNDYQLIDCFHDIPKDEDIVKIELFCEHPLSDIKQVMQEINQRFPMITSVTGGKYMLDSYHKDGGKGSALRFLQDKYQITPEETISFGDSLNDVSMMELSKYSMGMGNADPDFLRHCDYIVGTNEEQAVLNLLDDYTNHWDIHFLKNYKVKK